MPVNYSTSNLYLAAYLYAMDEGAFVSIDRGEDTYSNFIFKPEIQSTPTTNIEKDYWAGDGLIVPKKYANAIRALKEQLKR